MRVPSWKAEATRRYVMRARALLPFPASRKSPVPGSGIRASSGSSVSDLLGGGGEGGEKPGKDSPGGRGRLAVPNLSQPFHGKSLSLTVRRKMAELNPV